jgi:hypothetical protein
MNESNFVEIHRNFPGGLPAYSRDTTQRINSNDPRVIQVHIDNIISQGDECAVSFAKSLRGNTHLKYVCFGNNEYDSEHIDMVLLALTETKVIEIGIWSLASSNTSRRRGTCANYYATRIGKTINLMPMIKKLGFRGCSLGPSTAISLANNLAENKTLEQIDLSNNCIGDEGAIAFAYALRKNNTLKELILDNNQTSASGQMALRNSIYDDSSFDALEVCNHTIQSFFSVSPRSVLGKAVMNDCFHSLAANLRSRSKKEAITKKIHRYLQKKHNVKFQYQSFLGMQTGVMPFLLGFISMRCDVGTMLDIIRHMPHLLEMGGKLGNKNCADELNDQLGLLKIDL